ncbi:MAG: hypothetical protein HC915_17805 [Anaerolineae bacterium]|nr:hypothetical protein [Anaerolineae bacterium]
MDPDNSQIQCPNCGHVVELPYKPIEKQILDAVRSGERHMGKATTMQVAVQVFLSDDQTYRYLHKLEREGKVRRVGRKGGWRSAA